MKISIITILDNTNFGTYLQALATGLVIKSMGHDVEIIRYTRPFMTLKGYPRKILRERGFFSWVKHWDDIKGIIKLRNKDCAFLSTKVAVTEEYTSFEALCQHPPMADIYMTGSDQVWNSVYNRGIDKSYFLEFVPNKGKKIAYAASIGMNDFPDYEKDEILSYLLKYDKVTVREVAAQSILANMGIKSDVVLDPTLLLNKEDWYAISSSNLSNYNEKYLLIYSVEQKEQRILIDYYATKISKKYGLKIYQVSYGGEKGRIKCVDHFFSHATPDMFLNLFRFASYVVVSSFHGTAFAINFNKPFLTVAANNFNSRVENLLSITHLQCRHVNNMMLDVDSLQDIDYKSVNNYLSKEREKSLFLMQEMLCNTKNI